MRRMKDKAAASIAELRSLGPKSQAMLVRAGITTVDDLRRLTAA